MIEFDNILNQLDRMTKKQWLQLALLTLPCIVVAMHMGAMVYLGAEQPHTCSMPLMGKLVETCQQNWTGAQTSRYIPWDESKQALDTCSRYKFSDESLDCDYWWPEDANATTDTSSTESCSAWIYNNSMFTTTVVSDFDLVCEESYQRRLAQAIFMLGVTLGCVFWGQISDRFGRRLGILGPMATGLIFAVGTAFAHSFSMFTALRFFVGFCLFPGFSCAFVLGTESVKPKYRVWVGQTAQAFFAAGFCLLALLGFYIRTWRILQLAISAPIVLTIISQWFLFESPRWLICSKQYIIAQKIVKQLLSSAKNPYIEEAERLDNIAERQKSYKLEKYNKAVSDEESTEELKRAKKIYSVVDLLRKPNMRKKSLVLFYCWMVCSCVYYGLTLNAADLGGDPFINLFLSGLVEIPASYISVLLLEKWGRRPTLTFTLVFSGAACMFMMAVPKDLLWLNIVLSMAGKFNIAAAFGTVYIFAAEIYPTPIRNLGLGVCSSWARIGGILCPFIAMLDAVAKPLPYVVFGLMSIIGGVLALLLPEVLGIKLPETLEEGEEFGKDQQSPICGLCFRGNTGRNHNNNITTQDGANGNEYAKFLNGSKPSGSKLTDVESAV